MEQERGKANAPVLLVVQQVVPPPESDHVSEADSDVLNEIPDQPVQDAASSVMRADGG